MKQDTLSSREAWTREQIKFLRDHIGVVGWTVLKRKTGGRSKTAILTRIYLEFGGGGITRGTYQLQEAVRETGYSPSQLRRAAKALNQRWPRTGRGGYYLITGEQLEDMVTWLGHDFWSKRLELYACIHCGTKEKEHHRLGLCSPCYYKLRNRIRGMGLSMSRARLLDWVQSFRSDARVQRISLNLAKGRAPTLSDMEYLCDSTKPSSERGPSSPATPASS